MFRIDRRLIQQFDWWICAIALTLSIIGILTIFSATRQPVETVKTSFHLKQAVWIAFGLFSMLLFIAFDYTWLRKLAVPLYIVGLGLLIVVLVSGKTGMGAQRWISLKFVSFQPSEVFKLIFIILLSRYFSSMKGTLGIPGLFRVFFLIVLVPFALLLKQPDLGTALVILILFATLILTKGMPRKTLILILIIAMVSLPFFGSILWTGLKDYQKNRLIAFVDPGVDPSGIGYHITQSKVAIGSGEFFGKGFLKGTQGPFRFLPEKHTDFVFSVYAEEWGFFGSLVLLSLYLLLLMRTLDTAKKAKDDFGKFLSLGIAFMFSIYIFVNMGMTLGIMPVVGIPLPFMSYGGTAMLTNFVAVGILINIRMRRFILF